MLSVKVCLVAEGVSIDQQNNQASVFNIWEGFKATSYPFFLQRLCLFVLWEREPTDEQEYTVIVNVLLDQEIIVTHTVEINFRGRPRNRTVVRFDGLVVPKPGRLIFRASIEGEVAGEYSLTAETLQPTHDDQEPELITANP